MQNQPVHHKILFSIIRRRGKETIFTIGKLLSIFFQVMGVILLLTSVQSVQVATLNANKVYWLNVVGKDEMLHQSTLQPINSSSCDSNSNENGYMEAGFSGGWNSGG